MNEQIITAMAIQKLCPDAQYTYENNDLDTIQWIAGTNPPTSNEIRAEIPIVEAEVAQQAAEKAASKAQAEAKLAALGLTADDLKALGLGGN